jgi:hypothetical protein
MKEPGVSPARRDALRVFALLVVVAATLLVCIGTPEVGTGDAAGVVMSLPEQVGAFRGTEIPMAEDERRILPPGTELVRKRYARAEGELLVCTIVLSSADRRSIHKPEICLRGQGWDMPSGRVIDVPLSDGRSLAAMCLDISCPVKGGGGERMQGKFVYWFVGRDVTTPNHWQRILRTGYDRIVRGVAHRWAYVSVMAVETANLRPGADNAAGAQRMAEELVRDLAPQIMRSGPDRSVARSADGAPGAVQ